MTCTTTSLTGTLAAIMMLQGIMIAAVWRLVLGWGSGAPKAEVWYGTIACRCTYHKHVPISNTCQIQHLHPIVKCTFCIFPSTAVTVFG